MNPGVAAWKPLLHWQAARDRVLGNGAFRRWAAAFPLTRGIARRRARAVFDLCAGFVYSQVLLACIRLRLFDLLADGPQTAATLAHRLELPQGGADRLLAAAVALRLLDRRSGDRYGLGELGLAIRGDGAIAAMVEHNAALYADLADPVALLRSRRSDTALAAYWPYAAADRPAALAPERVAAYSALMSASQSLVAAELLAAHDFSRHRCLLDVGGGEGLFVTALARACPELRVMLFDLPAVAAAARARLAAAGLDRRATTFGGDFLSGPLPQGADAVSLVRVLHDHDDAEALHLLRAVHAALPAGGTLLVAEPMAGTPGAEPVGDAYFGFYLLAMGRGRPRNAGQIAEMLADAGFARTRQVPTRVPLQTGLVLATKA